MGPPENLQTALAMVARALPGLGLPTQERQVPPGSGLAGQQHGEARLFVELGHCLVVVEPGLPLGRELFGMVVARLQRRPAPALAVAKSRASRGSLQGAGFRV